MSRRYDVYGIGNALVDIQYEVDAAFVERKRIEKGIMTLVDEARQQELTESLADRPMKRSSGGSAANTMIAMANLGGKARYACKVGHDEAGDFFLDDLEAAGVDCNRASRGDGTTGRCLVLITPDADRTMNTFLGVTADFGPELVEEEEIARSEYLYIEGYLLTSDVGFEAARTAQSYARSHDTRVSLTLSDRFVIEVFHDRIRRIVEGGVDLLFCNEVEARTYTATSDTETAADALAGVVPAFAVTCGGDGAIIREGARSLMVPGFRVEAIDTNGAGDMFAGAYLFGRTHGQDMGQAGKLAAYASSRIVAQYGPRLERSLKDEVETILAL